MMPRARTPAAARACVRAPDFIRLGLRLRRFAPGDPDLGIILVPRESAESDHFLSGENDYPMAPKILSLPPIRASRPSSRRFHSTRPDPKAGAPTDGPLIGAHMSVAGGLNLGIERALKLRTRALQIFTKNANQWNAKPLEEDQCHGFRAAWEQSGLAPVVAHGSYLINLASPDPFLRRRSIEALADELRRAEALGVR